MERQQSICVAREQVTLARGILLSREFTRIVWYIRGLLEIQISFPY